MWTPDATVQNGRADVFLSGVDRIYWAIGFTAHLVLLIVLVIRQRARYFPVFTLLIALNVLRTVELFFVQRYCTKSAYFHAYWSLAIVDIALQLGVIYEMASMVFRPKGSWAKDVRHCMCCWIMVSLLVAAGLASFPVPASRIWEHALMVRGNIFSAALMSELFVGMIVLAARSGLPWKTHVARITQGLGVYSLAAVAIELARAYFGIAAGTVKYGELTRLRMTVYLICLVYWIVTLWQQAPPSKDMSERMQNQLSYLSTAVRLGAQLVGSRGIHK